MKLLSASWKNFQSYGNKLQTVTFSDDTGMFYHVLGENGSGKSTLSDVIKFGIYGKLGNKRLRDIPNRFNGETYVKIALIANGLNVVIERGLSPNFLKLWVDGVEYDQAGKKNVEEYIEDEIIGLPFYVFNNIVSLSINDFKSFLTMSPHDKRMIIDKIFNLELINSAKWLVKEELKSLKESAISYTKQVESIQRTIDNSEVELQSLKEKIVSNAQKKIEDLTSSIEKYNESLLDISSKIENVEQKISEGNDKMNGLQELLNKNKVVHRGINEKLSLYENKKCPMCESDLTTDFHKSILEEIVDKEIKVKQNIEKLTENVNQISQLKQKLVTAKSSFANKRVEFATTIAAYKKEIEKLQKSDTTLETQSIEKIIKESEEMRIQTIHKSDNITNKVNFFKIIDELFGDNGVKQLAITKIMPALNSEIRAVLTDLRMNYKVTFNRSFDASITHLGHDVAIQQLSTGEKKKIDFAVLLAIIRMMKLKYPSMNVVFLDEIFASIDSDGIHHILKILSDLTKCMGINIFVVNHAPLPSEIFDYKINVAKPNNFSTVDIEKID